MNRLSFLMMPLVLMAAAPGGDAGAFETDVLPTAAGDLKITFIGHASLMFEFGGKVIYSDPSGQYGDFSGLPKADLILAAHDHFDHFDKLGDPRQKLTEHEVWHVRGPLK